MRWWSLIVLGCVEPQSSNEMVPPVAESPPEVPGFEARTPVPVSVPLMGGTLEMRGKRVVAADPERDRIAFAHEDAITDVTIHELAPGSVPFRVAIGDEHAWVTLRGTGEVLVFGLDGELARRIAVCPHPRGVAVQDGLAYVACAGGELAQIDAVEHTVEHVWLLEPDLRDVVVEGADVWVSTFRSSQVLRVNATDGSVIERIVPDLERTTRVESQPRVGWRLRAHPEGGAIFLHQSATDRPVDLDVVPGPGAPYYGGTPSGCPDGEPPDVGLVGSHLTRIWPDGTHQTSGRINALSMTTDVVPMGDTYLLAATSTRPRAAQGRAVVQVMDPDHHACVPSVPLASIEGLTSVAMDSGGGMVAYDRHLGRILTHRGTGQLPDAVASTELAAARWFDFDPGTGVTCASCHPEGQDDGHVWVFNGLGLRRTQNLAGGLTMRNRFHWEGEFSSLDQLMQVVFEDRMGGPPTQIEDRFELYEWLDGIPVVRASSSAPPEVLEEGRIHFESPEVGCTSCHVGVRLTDDALRGIDRLGFVTKTPSLLGVGTRPPFMRTGCAKTLDERFTDERCGGDLHGNLSVLDDDQLDALIAYVSTL